MVNSLDFKGAIFDLDGTLLDSMFVWHYVDQAFLVKRGIMIPEDYVNAINGLSFKDAAIYTINRFNLNLSVSEVMCEWMDLAYHTYANDVKLKKGVKDYLHYLKENNIKIASASALAFPLAEACLKNLNIFHLFDAFTSIEEVNKSKEFPDIYLLAAQKLNLKTKECIVFEDILKGIQSAKSTGMHVVGCFDEINKAELEEIKISADIYINDFLQAPRIADSYRI